MLWTNPNSYNEEFELYNNIVNIWDVILDIWSNIWNVALYLAHLSWNKWKVYCFEPSKRTFNYLKQNIKLNKILANRMKSYNIGLWEKDCKIKFSDNHNDDMNKINDKWNTIVEIKRIDDMIDIDALDNIEFAKIDVEWYEYGVLKWWYNTFSKKVKTIYFELNEELLNSAWNTCKDILSLTIELWFTNYKVHRNILFKIPSDYIAHWNEYILATKDINKLIQNWKLTLY